MKTKKEILFIVVCAVSIMAGAFMGSGTGLLSGAGTNLLSGESYTLAQLRGAIDCNCDSCTNESDVKNECMHMTPSSGDLNDVDANGTAPEPPGPGDPIPTGTGCSSRYCIKNTIWYAECDEEPNGAGCPTKLRSDQYSMKQEVKDSDGEPNNTCGDPNYTVESMFTPSDCKKFTYSGVLGTCVTESCEGIAVTNMYDHDNDPNTPDESWYDYDKGPNRTVCDSP